MLEQAFRPRSGSPGKAIPALLIALGIIVLIIGAAAVFTSFPVDPGSPPAFETVAYRVAGPSMAPTMLGDSMYVHCIPCDLGWQIVPTTDAETVCWHCGSRVSTAPTMATIGDVVSIQRPDSRSLQRGDVIALEHEGKGNIKRIVAVPGDVVDRSGLRFSVNGRPIGDFQWAIDGQTIPIDFDDHRRQSRWQKSNETPLDDPAQDPQTRVWTLTDTPSDDWLVYHHRSVHDQNRPSGVWDDYPINHGLSRAMEAVESLIFQATTFDASPDAELEAVFWSSTGNVRGTIALVTGGVIDIDQARLRVESEREPSESPVSSRDPVSAANPVAIRIVTGSAVLTGLTLRRHLDYRLRRRDDTSVYPMQLGADDYFVLGDNVPVSVDSRNYGPIQAVDMIGYALPPQRN